ncbi:phage portal protein [Anaerosacchariphilus polymeriproducens]|nr:phage portal protein [Anaerosacchariphilus polymeriproducens]
MTFLEKWFPMKEIHGSCSIIVDIPAELYYKELALYTGISLLANAIAKCEIKTYVDHAPVKDRDYYCLNVSPNPNESSSQFWHKVIEKVIRGGEALVIETNGNLYCADSYCVKEERPIIGNSYQNISVGNFTFTKTWGANDVYLFRLDNTEIGGLLNGMSNEYNKLISAAAKSYKQSNGSKFKLHIEGAKAGDKEFNKEFEETIKKQLATFMENEYSIYPEFEGYELTSFKESNPKNADDLIKLRKDMFEIVGQALKIPQTLMSGNITNMNEITKVFLTFAVDPLADMIAEVLNKRAGFENWVKGSFYKMDTGKINHRDIFEIAQSIDKLIACGSMCIDELREELGYEALNTPFSRQHFMTKNYEKIEQLLKQMVEGGEMGNE